MAIDTNHWLIPDEQGAFHPTAYEPGMEYTGFVARERSRIAAALRECDLDSPLCRELLAAQQALAWAMDPDNAASPFDSIRGHHPDVFGAGEA